MENLEEKIEQEQSRLDSLKTKRAALDKKIKKSEDNLERYSLMQKSGMYTSLMEATKGTGVCINDILTALQSGDLLSLQEQIEKVKVPAPNDGNDANS